MIHLIAVCLTNKAVNLCSNSDNKDEYEILLYCIETIIGQSITYALLIFIGVLMNDLVKMVIYIVFLVALRGQTGGYHANSHIGCIAFSCIISALAVSISKSLCIEWILPFICFSIIYIIYRAPIKHINLNLSAYEIEQLYISIKRVISIEVISICIFIIINATFLVIPACLAIITVAASIMLAKILKQEVA
ncbi:accessory gene regulator B family protein [Anaerocolumna jejuensis]|uniref:accessory gene regulator B family protein n=1 Tax=Anaerocolumna jejuensis TaxID=259063 RepID=UPI003F7CD2A2